MPAALLRAPERIVNDPAHTERGVHTDLGGDLVGRANADRTAGAGVGTLGALADHDEVDVRIARQRTAHPRVQPAGPQIDVMVEFEPDTKQQATFQHTAWHRRVTDRAEQNRVVRP